MIMEVKDILEILRNYYYDKTGQSGESNLNSTENCAFNAVVKTFSKDELKEANALMSDHLMPLTMMVWNCANPLHSEFNKKNTNISVLIERFIDKKSRCVGESRKEILRRFPYQDVCIQKKIIKAFLCSNAISDIEWAAAEADKHWDKSYSVYIRNAYDKHQSRKLALTVIRRMPTEYVRSNESSLVMHSRSEFCIRLGDESDALIHKYDLSIFEILYVKARLGKRPNLPEQQIERQFFSHVFTQTLKASLGINNKVQSIERIPWLNRAVWALGELGYRDILMKFIALKRYIIDSSISQPQRNELYLIQKWISENFFPYAMPHESIDWDRISERIKKVSDPRSIRIENRFDLDKYDDLPPEIIELVSDLI